MSYDYVVCKVCGAHCKLLTKHISMKHHMSKDEYYSIYGYQEMICESTKLKYHNALVNNWTNPEYRKRCSSYWRSKEHSEECRTRMTEYHKSGKINGELISKGIMSNPESRKARSDRMKSISNKLWSTDEYRNMKSRQAYEQLDRELKSGTRYSKSQCYTKSGRLVRSSYEKVVAEYLDDNKIEYSYESLRVPYNYGDRDRIYIPDFYIPSKNLVIEVKAHYQLKYDIVQVKRSATELLGYNYIFITENELDKLSSLIQ